MEEVAAGYRLPPDAKTRSELERRAKKFYYTGASRLDSGEVPLPLVLTQGPVPSCTCLLSFRACSRMFQLLSLTLIPKPLSSANPGTQNPPTRQRMVDRPFPQWTRRRAASP